MTRDQVADVADRLERIATRVRFLSLHSYAPALQRIANGLREGVLLCPDGTPWWSDPRWMEFDELARSAERHLDELEVNDAKITKLRALCDGTAPGGLLQ